VGNVFTCLKDTKDKGVKFATDIVDTNDDGVVSQAEKDAAIGAIKDGVETVVGLVEGWGILGDDSDKKDKKKKKRPK